MKVELERQPGEPERYRVRIAEDDAVAAGKIMGIATRTSDTTWTFAPHAGGALAFDDSIVMTLTAKDADELKAVISQRFGVLDLPADRLMDDTVEAFASNMLMPLSSLATHTHSIVGLIKALSRQVAVIAVHDIHESKREEFLLRFDQRLREEVVQLGAELAAKRAAAESMKAMLREVVEKALRPDGDTDGPTKH